MLTNSPQRKSVFVLAAIVIASYFGNYILSTILSIGNQSIVDEPIGMCQSIFSIGGTRDSMDHSTKEVIDYIRSRKLDKDGYVLRDAYLYLAERMPSMYDKTSKKPHKVS